MKVNNHVSTFYTLTFTVNHYNCECLECNNYKDLYWHLISHEMYNTPYHVCNTVCMYPRIYIYSG